MKNQPIGFMDSGVGGFSVVKEVMNLLPNEQLYFIGDSARNPYGSRPMEEVLAFSKELAQFLLSKNIKLLVIACNTATAAALEVLKKELPIPVIGVIEPGSQSAVERTKNNIIGVIATEGAVQSGEYKKALQTLKPAAQIKSIACQEFVTIVEKNNLNPEETPEAVARCLRAFDGFAMDTLVLGCTHFPLLESYIQGYFSRNISLINPGVETAKTVKEYLTKHHLLNTETLLEKHVFYTTGSPEKFTEVASRWLEQDNFKVETISLKELTN